MSGGLFSKLDTDIITFHILPHLDGKTLIILSSVSSQSNNLICSNNHYSKNLWQNICISTWPSLLATPAVPDFYFSGLKNFHSNVISTLPGGYRTFFSDAFPLIHSHDLNTINPPPPSPPLFIRFYYAVDVFLHGQPHPFSSLCATQLVQTRQVFDDFMGFKFRLYPLKHKLKNFIKVKKQGFEEYLKQNLTLSCVVIETKVSKHAGSLFTPGCKPGCKPVEVKPAATSGRVKVIFETLLPSLSNLYTQMIKCRTKMVCGWQGDAEDKFCVKCVYSTFKDMNGKRLLERHAAIIILNAIIDGERKNKQN